MKLLIATPAFQGLLTTEYFNSFIQTLTALSQKGVSISTLTAERDGLISRARNRCATIALEAGFDKILFIDSDIVWRPEHVLELLSSNKLIVGGTYPYRELPLKLVFTPIKADHTYGREPHSFKVFAEAESDADGLVAVKYLPTGFLMIDTSVLLNLSTRRPKYTQFDVVTNSQTEVYDFFPIQIVERDNGTFYEAEDWGFCNLAHEAGYSIYLNTKVVVDHIGQYRFSVK